jgi:hypothetical protein
MSKTKNQPADSTQQKYYLVDYRNIKPMPESMAGGGNVRQDYGDIMSDIVNPMINRHERGIKHLIYKPLHGYREPGTSASEDKWISVDGHRRLRACAIFHEMTGIAPMVRMLVEDMRGKTDVDLIDEMVLSSLGKQLNALELSRVVARYEQLGLSHKDIAARMGRPTYVNYVRDLSRLATAPQEIHDLLLADTISFTQVKDVMNKYKDWHRVLTVINDAAAKKAQSVADESDEPMVSEKTEKPKKITRRDISSVTGQLDSMAELRMALKKDLPSAQRIIYTQKGKFEHEAGVEIDLHEFLERIVLNKITQREIALYLYL